MQIWQPRCVLLPSPPAPRARSPQQRRQGTSPHAAIPSTSAWEYEDVPLRGQSHMQSMSGVSRFPRRCTSVPGRKSCTESRLPSTPLASSSALTQLRLRLRCASLPETPTPGRDQHELTTQDTRPNQPSPAQRSSSFRPFCVPWPHSMPSPRRPPHRTCLRKHRGSV